MPVKKKAKKKKKSTRAKSRHPAVRSSAKSSGKRELNVPMAEVQDLIDLLEARGLEEFELEREGFRIRIKRQGVAGAAVVVPNQPSAPPAAVSPAPAAEEPAGAAADELGNDVHIIKSPIVGTFYASARPDAPLFVQLGDKVTTGQTLCIIEAMKLMNEIEADVAGEIVKIFVENAHPVEYGEPLFAVRPG